MNIKEFKIFYRDICEIKNDNIIKKYLMFNYLFVSLLKSRLTNGINNEIAKRFFYIWKQFKEILEYEIKMYEIILNNKDKIDSLECKKVIGNLDKLSKRTEKYFYQRIDNLVNNCEIKQDFSSRQVINKYNQHLSEVIGLTISFDDIKIFLNYQDEFWNYIKPKTRFVDSRADSKHLFYETIMHFDDNKCLDDMRVFVPNIINLFTACVNVHEFTHAYDLYKKLGHEIEEDISGYEQKAELNEKKFILSYVLKKNN